MTVKLVLSAALLLQVGCWFAGPPADRPRARLKGHGGPVTVHVVTMSSSGRQVWERTLLTWPSAPVFLSDGVKPVMRLWVVGDGVSAQLYLEEGGIMEEAVPPPDVHPVNTGYGEVKNIPGPGGVKFQITVERL